MGKLKEEAGQRLLAMRDVVAYQKDLQEWALSECLAGQHGVACGALPARAPGRSVQAGQHHERTVPQTAEVEVNSAS